ncbi:hypothetical protein CRE_12478 [Caenorhabditis remanei]|uniref:Golgi apparatus membrane protein TVP23 homolog n=1 Tax=Caenorhabditis remanei TaxID=31234 RepID=E3M744_CAERE|nr:hypothetical protein CRE_12478 [Caenorhabditis remanei]
MRTGNTTEREAPWKLEFKWDRLLPPKWKRPYLIWTHVLLKLVALITIMFGAPGVNYFEGEGYVIDNIKAEFNATVFTFLAVLDFFVTKNIIGPKLTGLHHGFKVDEENHITYHFYAEKDFLSRYPSTDRDSFFTFMVFFSLVWIIKLIPVIITLSIFWIPFTILGFTSVYLNLYLFVQTRYYRQWTMSKFFAAWLYNFFMRIEFAEGDDSGNTFRNSYENRMRY